MNDVGFLPQFIHCMRFIVVVTGAWAFIGFIILQKTYLSVHIRSNTKAALSMIFGIPFLAYILCLLLVSIALFATKNYPLAWIMLFFFVVPYLISARSSGTARAQLEVALQMIAICASLAILIWLG